MHFDKPKPLIKSLPIYKRYWLYTYKKEDLFESNNISLFNFDLQNTTYTHQILYLISILYSIQHRVNLYKQTI